MTEQTHPDDDFVTRARRYRDEHEATHEDEMCGGPCIVLGLADAPRTEAPDLRAALAEELRQAYDRASETISPGEHGFFEALVVELEASDTTAQGFFSGRFADAFDSGYLSALSATPAPERLDVETLALALDAPGVFEDPLGDQAQPLAEAIAGEYERLTRD